MVQSIGEIMEDKLYPSTLFEDDLRRIKGMNISFELQLEKAEALANIYFNQNNENMIDHLAIGDMRDQILKEE